MDALAEIFAQFKENDGLDEVATSEFRTDGCIESAKDAKKFILGGNAYFTLVSKKTQTRFTYHVNLSDNGQLYFVSVLNGPDNWSNYKYVGHMFNTSLLFNVGKKCKISPTSPSIKAFAWVWLKLLKGEMPESLEVWHEGKCGRCGRKLTVPSSIAQGFGPECITKI